MKVSISAVIITYNEEKNIGRCLESLKTVADDIVVVDSFSTDNTGDICRKYGARFITHAFAGHIEQKNYAVTQSKFPFVLSLDADEMLSEELAGSIIKVKENWKADGYTFNRLNNYCGKWVRHCGWYPDKKLRLWDSRKGKWTGVNPHDRFEMEPGSGINHLKGDLLHFSYNSISQHVDQMNRFSEIAAGEYHKKGRKIPTCITLIRMMVIFIKKYFIKLGFLDGYYGIVISIMSAYSVFLKDIKLKELNKKS
ncbi:MAG: glycosyltransferase family 2 protein [Bacteroidales bacterium]|nr:glycosyltransferase family 2 protein [Bacteroidales bacterium]